MSGFAPPPMSVPAPPAAPITSPAVIEELEAVTDGFRDWWEVLAYTDDYEVTYDRLTLMGTLQEYITILDRSIPQLP